LICVSWREFSFGGGAEELEGIQMQYLLRKVNKALICCSWREFRLRGGAEDLEGIQI